jgi:hypothetical protein
LKPRRPSRAAGDAGISASDPRQLAAALVRADGSVPPKLDGVVSDALAELLELAGTFQDLPLESVNPMLRPERWE